jgi:superfamily II DNA or RNA helicase/HKD family nuclease/diadenosine tetraphosphate (Ap4A) HIT family hydrolase
MTESELWQPEVEGAALCPFCEPDAERIAFRTPEISAIRDAFPVTEGHLLIVPRRHVARWDDLDAAERDALRTGIERGRALLKGQFDPDAFNVGYNDGAAAGQTIPHFHVHIIPRRSGDVGDPRGGVRHVIPAKGNYLAPSKPTLNLDLLARAPHRQSLIAGGEDPLLPHLVRHIDDASAVDIAVAFIMESGARLLIPHLRDLLARGGRLRFITGDYLDVSDPSALRRLLDLEGQEEAKVERFVFEAGAQSFHLKSWIFHHSDGHGLAIVGSSNLSETALLKGIEWNYRACSAESEGWRDVVAGFEALLQSPCVKPLAYDWIEAYDRRRAKGVVSQAPIIGVVAEPPPPPRQPHEVQLRALEALGRTRREGYSAGLVVLATGLGKTWLSAFDTDAPEFRRVLFVAHREEILTQAIETYRSCRPNARLGRYTGAEKEVDADIIFASIQTLGRSAHLEKFAPDYFDYIVVDEFHHAAARTYRGLIDHFTPKFLLGLTATPERADGGDLLSLCQENLVFRCDAFEAIDKALLSPFRYFGVPDEIDYENIPWRSSKFDEAALTAAVATQTRAQNALEQYLKRRGTRTLGFCCSTIHADFMADYFRQAGLRAAAVHSGETSAPRATSLEQLRAGELDVLFAVDMFNEGVDVPSIDTVLMLRPTESAIIWMQQFGRGLRKAAGKTQLAVIDYIGNHRTFLTKVRALLGVSEGDRALSLALEKVRAGERLWPEGCDVTYELEALDILARLLRPTSAGDALEAFFRDFQFRNGVRPTATEVLHAGFNPRSSGHGGWLNFVRHMGGLTERESEVIVRHAGFLGNLERTPMTRSYKMLVLKAMQQAGEFPGGIWINALTEGVRRLAAQNPVFGRDISVPIDQQLALRRLVEENPIRAWTGEGQRSDVYFSYGDGQFATTFAVSDSDRPALNELTRELVDWRIAAYLARSEGDEPALEVPGLALVAEEQAAWTGPELWREYMREQIPPLYGLKFSTGSWNQGFVVLGRHVFLLVTLKKDGFIQDHQYDDGFLSPTRLRWHSQNRTKPQSRDGRIISGAEPDYEVHLFVRSTKKRGQVAAPFIYCGDVEFVSWEGSQPITVEWQMSSPVPSHLRRVLEIPS